MELVTTENSGQLLTKIMCKTHAFPLDSKNAELCKVEIILENRLPSFVVKGGLTLETAGTSN